MYQPKEENFSFHLILYVPWVKHTLFLIKIVLVYLFDACFAVKNGQQHHLFV
jgi:hypothetical protein